MACSRGCAATQAQQALQRSSSVQSGIPLLVPSVAALQPAFGLSASQRYRSAAIVLRQTCRAARGAKVELSETSSALMDSAASASASQPGTEQPTVSAAASAERHDTLLNTETAGDGVPTASRQGSDRGAKRQSFGKQPPAKASRSSLISEGRALTSNAIARALGRQQEVCPVVSKVA